MGPDGENCHIYHTKVVVSDVLQKCFPLMARYHRATHCNIVRKWSAVAVALIKLEGL